MLTAMKFLGIGLALLVPGGSLLLLAMLAPKVVRRMRRLEPAPTAVPQIPAHTQ